jgi:hypothetical protein
MLRMQLSSRVPVPPSSGSVVDVAGPSQRMGVEPIPSMVGAHKRSALMVAGTRNPTPGRGTKISPHFCSGPRTRASAITESNAIRSFAMPSPRPPCT